MLQGSKGLGTTGTIGRIGTIVINIIVIVKIWIWKYSSYEDLISLKSYTIFLFIMMLSYHHEKKVKVINYNWVEKNINLLTGRLNCA